MEGVEIRAGASQRSLRGKSARSMLGGNSQRGEGGVHGVVVVVMVFINQCVVWWRWWWWWWCAVDTYNINQHDYLLSLSSLPPAMETAALLAKAHSQRQEMRLRSQLNLKVARELRGRR